MMDSLDDMAERDEYFRDISVVMICLGSRVNRGTKEFTKVDFDYVMEAGKMA